MIGICWMCGKLLVDGVGNPITPVERTVGGNPIKLHKTCAKTFDADKPLTARDTSHDQARPADGS